MYRLTLYFLIVLVASAVVLSFLGIMHENPLDILINTLAAVIVCYIANIVFAKLFNAVPNIESVFITSLILVLIIPTKFPVNVAFIILASGVAMASKYFLTIDKRHVFNPAAAAVAGISMLSAEHSATWWLGTPAMFPIVLIGGLLVVHKIQRETMVFTFLVAYFVLIGIAAFVHFGTIASAVNALQVASLHSALAFFAFVMFTEPLTSPGRKKQRIWYALFVAVLYATPQLRLSSFVFTPELALCAGNIFSYIINPNYRVVMKLQQRLQVSKDTFAFLFQPQYAFSFVPGQYMEWTLPHAHADSRGNRRYFSLASSPKENQVMLTVRMYQPSSSFKSALLQMKQGEQIIASHVAGDFVLPKDKTKPLVFIAGGIGIAPFRGMIQSLIDSQEKRDIVIVYINRKVEDIAFVDFLQKAASVGVRAYYVLTDKTAIPKDWWGGIGHVTPEMLAKAIPDFVKRTFYISGPQLMVEEVEKTLGQMHIPSSQVITDYFPGY